MNQRKKNRVIYTVLLAICMIGFWLFENFYTPGTYSIASDDEDKTEVYSNLIPSSTTGEIIHHDHFMLSYNEDYEQAEWVAYVLKKSHLTYDDRKRPFFIEDPKVKSKSADWRNYKGSGYDRGHLCPAGDRRFSKYAYNETFYTSNISPQDRDFNAGLWNRLEVQVRRWSKRYDDVFVVTGGVLHDGLEEIGDEDVAVPKTFYKIISRGKGDNLEAIAFLMPNKESSKALQNFVVSIDKIEQLTGIDFFHEFPDSIETRVERSSGVSNWKF